MVELCCNRISRQRCNRPIGMRHAPPAGRQSQSHVGNANMTIVWTGNTTSDRRVPRPRPGFKVLLAGWQVPRSCADTRRLCPVSPGAIQQQPKQINEFKTDCSDICQRIFDKATYAARNEFNEALCGCTVSASKLHFVNMFIHMFITSYSLLDCRKCCLWCIMTSLPFLGLKKKSLT